MGASDDHHHHHHNQDQMISFHQLPPPSILHHHHKNDHRNDGYGLNYNTCPSSSSSLDNSTSTSTSTSIGSESSSSSCSDSFDLGDDATSSSCSSSSSSSVADLGSHSSMFELSELMDSLPIKRGLSKFYQGKSQSFTSLTRVTSIEDLVKKENPYNNNSYNRRKMLKGSKSYANGLDACKPYTLHKSILISKQNNSSNQLVSSFSSFPAQNGSFLSRPPIGPSVQRKT